MAFYHLQINNLSHTASYALYCYDHLLVISDEVERIWKRPFHLPSLLYVLHRYLTHVGFIVMQIVLHERGWPSGPCDRLIRLPHAMVIMTFALTATILILRMYSMFWKNRILLSCLSIVLLGQVVIMAVCLGTGVRSPFSPGCVLTSTASYFGAFWAAPLATDAVLLALALYRLYDHREFRIRSTLVEQLLRDGTPYIAEIFCVNLLNVVAFYTAPDDLRELGAAFTPALTSLLVARLQLNLAEGDRERGRDVIDAHHLFVDPSLAHETDDSGRALDRLRQFFALGNMGAQIKFPELDSAASLESLEGALPGREHKYHYRRRTLRVAPNNLNFDFDPLPPSLGIVHSSRNPT